MTKDDQIEDLKEIEVTEEMERTEASVVEAAVAEAYFATERGKRDIAYRKELAIRAQKYSDKIDDLHEEIGNLQDEVAHLNKLLEVVTLVATNQPFDIKWGNLDN
jgi:hypothetical protein